MSAATKPRTVPELALATKTVLVERGRGRRRYESLDGCVCTAGARNVALGLHPDGRGADAWASHMWEQFNEAFLRVAGRSVTVFNDATKDDAEVFAVLDQIAAGA